MRKAILAPLLALAVAGCVSSAAADSPRADVVITIGAHGRLASSETGERRRAPWIEVATNRERFVELWDRYVPGDGKAADAIQFDREMAVFLLLGPQPTGGYAIEPFDVDVEGVVVRVRAKLVQPMTPDEVTQVITAPYAVVRAPAVVFERVEWVGVDGRLIATRVEE